MILSCMCVSVKHDNLYSHSTSDTYNSQHTHIYDEVWYVTWVDNWSSGTETNKKRIQIRIKTTSSDNTPQYRLVCLVMDHLTPRVCVISLTLRVSLCDEVDMKEVDTWHTRGGHESVWCGCVCTYLCVYFTITTTTHHHHCDHRGYTIRDCCNCKSYYELS